MNTYIYTDNKTGKEVLQVVANTILEADTKLEEQTKINPVKMVAIGCQVIFVKKTP